MALAVVAERPEKDTGRLEAFSDGVFAIAITLLALELKVPHFEGSERVTSAALAAGLLHLWPSYFAFATSFFTVLIMWVHHHVIFKLVRCTDIPLLFANGFLLMLVTLVPFPTAVVAEYLRTPAAAAACTFYAGFFVLISLGFWILLWAAFRTRVVDPEASPAAIQRLRRSYALGPPCYLAAAAAGPFSPWLAMGICTTLWIVWAATTREC
jgi:uncharacterized membrane protein